MRGIPPKKSSRATLSKDVFERRTSTGSEAFFLFICLEDIKFSLLTFFSLLKTIYPRVLTKPLPNDPKSPLPVDVRRSKRSLLKFPNTHDRNASSISTETLCDLIRMILTMNNFSFNDKHYLQTHGTAMGTRMAPSYANLFLAKFETDALSRAPFQPFIWWRYIDDIFMIWPRSVQDLNTFTSFLNDIHPTIKFTCDHSFTPIPFLDVNVSLHNGKQNRH